MDGIELETPGLLEGDDRFGGSLVELIVAASDTSEDQWEIADRIDELVDGGRAQLDTAGREQPWAAPAPTSWPVSDPG